MKLEPLCFAGRGMRDREEEDDEMTKEKAG